MTAEKLAEMIGGIDAVNYRMVLLAGGEPSLSPKLVRRAIEVCKERNILCAIVTSPVWAKSMETAHHFLQKVAGLNFIILSYDDYHLEFLTIEHYRYAMTSALSRGIRIIFQIAYTDDEQLSRLANSLGPMNVPGTQINSMRTVLVGNAKRNNLHGNEVQIHDVDDIDKITRGCVLGNSFIDEQMNLHGCCWSTVSNNSPFTKKKSGKALPMVFQDLEKDMVFQAVRKTGFIDSLSRKNREKIVAITKGSAFSCECDLCIKMMNEGDKTFWDDVAFGVCSDASMHT